MAAPKVKACRKTVALIIILCLLLGNPYCRSTLKLKICGLYRRGILGQGKIHIYNKAIYLFVSYKFGVMKRSECSLFHKGGVSCRWSFCGGGLMLSSFERVLYLESGLL